MIIITFVQLFMPYFTVEYTKAYTAHTNFTVASFTGHRKAFCCSHWENVGFGMSPLRLTMQVASVPLGLVSTQVSLTSRSIHLAKLPFFQKPVAVVVIVDLVRLKIVEWRKGTYARDKLNYVSTRPLLTFALKVVCKRGGEVFSGAYLFTNTVNDGAKPNVTNITMCK